MADAQSSTSTVARPAAPPKSNAEGFSDEQLEQIIAPIALYSDSLLAQMLMAANTPMLLKAALVDGNVDSGVMASGQVVGVIDDLPSCAELIERIIAEARETLARLSGEIPE